MSDFRKLSIFRLVGIAGAVGLLAGLAAGGPQGSETPESARAIHGKTVYRVYCTSCHGAAGEGDGKLAQYLTIEPADLTRLTVGNGGEFPAERVRQVIDGRVEVPGHEGDMPHWGEVLQKIDVLENEPPEVREAEVARRIDDLVAYLRSIQVAE